VSTSSRTHSPFWQTENAHGLQIVVQPTVAGFGVLHSLSLVRGGNLILKSAIIREAFTGATLALGD
jgi:hypothetical protein